MGEVIGQAASHNTAADDNDAGRSREFTRHVCILIVKKVLDNQTKQSYFSQQ